MRIKILVVSLVALALIFFPFNLPAQDTFFATADHFGNVFIYPSNGDGTFGQKVLIGSVTLPPPYEYPYPAVADFDRDGDLDVAIHDQQSVYLLVNDGANFTPIVAVTFYSEHLPSASGPKCWGRGFVV